MSDARNAGEPAKLTDAERQQFRSILKAETHPEVFAPLTRMLDERRSTPYMDDLLRRLWRKPI